LSFIEECLAAELKAENIDFDREVRFAPDRLFRADFHIIGTPLLVEIDGGAYTQGRHTRPKGFLKDREKDALAFRLGYVPMHLSPEQVQSGEAVQTIKAALVSLVEIEVSKR
jgi:very-short-patch-repair endonuclease